MKLKLNLENNKMNYKIYYLALRKLKRQKYKQFQEK